MQLLQAVAGRQLVKAGRQKAAEVELIHIGYAVAILATFGYGISTYFRRPEPEVDDGSDFAYVQALWGKGLIDDAAFEALVIMVNDPDITFVRPAYDVRSDPPKRSFLERIIDAIKELPEG